MYLKSLTLKGFKSFAETTALELEPGITVVVGPNGSGKSNLVDAMAWVLGAQGPTTVRSSKMDDVIFAGTAHRPALGRAEVALTIDNTSGMLPLDLVEVTISRTLFRSGDSEYALNGVPCRLLDIQELLSDSGVGRTQHVIVGQNQLDSVLNARPEDRRAVVEEAAGVLKFRRRKEKAERRLSATEASLVRLSDMLREVRRARRPLERQAEAARRSGDLTAELLALRRHAAGRELEALRRRLEATAGQREQLAADEAGSRAELSQLDTGVLAAEAELSARGADDLGEELIRAERLQERARGLAAVLAERRRGALRDRTAVVDGAVVATLEAEAARLRAELAEARDEAAALVPDAERLSREEATLEAERAALEPEHDQAAPGPVAEAADARAELAALRIAVERSRSEAGRLEANLAALRDKETRLAAEAGRLTATRAAAAEEEASRAARLTTASEHRASAEAALAGAQAALQAATADAAGWRARVDALTLALDESRARAGAGRVAGLDGVLGVLADLVEVDPGWEAAVEAAIGPALATVVVGELDDAMTILAALRRDGPGAVLPLAAVVPRAEPATAGEPVRAHVRSRLPGVERALDLLLAGACCVDGDWAHAAGVAAAHPAAVVVTRDGDRFAADGWRVGATGPGATGAALTEAEERATTAAEAAAAAETAATDARTALAAAADDERAAARDRDEAEARGTAAGVALPRLEADVAEFGAEARSVEEHLRVVSARVTAEEARLADLEAEVARLAAVEEAQDERAREARSARARLEERAGATAALRTDLEVRAAGLEERRAFLGRRLEEVEVRLAGSADERGEVEERRDRLDRRILVLDRLAGRVEARRAAADATLADVRERRRQQSEAARATAERLDDLRRRRVEAEAGLEAIRERSRRAELEAQEVTLRVETATETVRRELDCEPDATLASPCPPLPEGVTVAARTREVERELRLLGPVNPLALEELTALQERSDFLEGQLDDVRASRRELGRVVRAIDEEIVRTFVAAFADVSENFSRLFETLFPGGEGRLRLTDPEDPLGTGIEVEARPSGKNVRKLSLLSGGERALTALAFLFAVFRSRPSPFYVLDEVEAALDDINLARFLDLVEEFRREAQLVIVTHQRRTMECADTLYGVSMQPGGPSKVIRERVTAGASA